jgi:hypothetical protein
MKIEEAIIGMDVITPDGVGIVMSINHAHRAIHVRGRAYEKMTCYPEEKVVPAPMYLRTPNSDALVAEANSHMRARIANLESVLQDIIDMFPIMGTLGPSLMEEAATIIPDNSPRTQALLRAKKLLEE